MWRLSGCGFGATTPAAASSAGVVISSAAASTSSATAPSGPPPAGGTTAGVEAINDSATRLRGLAAAAATADPTNLAALAGLQNTATDALTNVGGSFDVRNNVRPFPVKAALVAAPHGKVFAG